MSITPLMNLTLPTVGPGGTAGPDWANILNAAITLVDSHDHTTGKGAKITVSALNINADLPIGTSVAPNNLTFAKSVRFQSQSASLGSASDKSCVYVAGGDLYYNNDSGVVVQLTSGSGINLSSVGSIGGDYSTTPGASVAYNDTTKLYLFKQTASQTADIAGGSLFIYENVSGGKYTKLKVPTGLSSNIDITLLGSLPLTTLPLSVSSTGVLSTGTIDTAQITEAAVTAAKISAGAVTQAKLALRTTGTSVAAGGIAISASSGQFVTVSPTMVDVTNLSVTITTTGRPVWVGLIPDGNGTDPSMLLVNYNTLAANPLKGYFGLYNGATQIGMVSVAIGYNNSLSTGPSDSIEVPVGSLHTIDLQSAGTYTYTVKAMAVSGPSDRAHVYQAKLVAYEL